MSCNQVAHELQPKYTFVTNELSTICILATMTKNFIQKNAR